MGAQSVRSRDIDSIQDKAEELILKNAQYHILESNFALSKKIDKDEVKHASKLLSFICTDNCDLKDFINKALLEGPGLEPTCISSEAVDLTLEFSDYTQIFEDNLG